MEAPSWQARLADWEARRSRAARRSIGAIWTPDELAGFMADWVGEAEPREVLDPAAGAGALLAPFEGSVKRVACEREPQLRRVLAARYPDGEVHGDFWQLDPARRFGAIVANPPYIGHTGIEDKQAIHAALAEASGVRLPMTTNLAVLFYLGCWQRLEVGGRMVFLMPTEFMQTRAGVAFKRFLLEESAASAIVDLDDDGLFGPGVVSTACLVAAERPGPSRITFARHTGRAPYPTWAALIASGRSLPHDGIAPERRWRPERHGAPEGDHQPLSALCDVRPGLISGRNDFFLVSMDEARRRGIRGSVTYCLIRPHQLGTEWFLDMAEMVRSQESGERRFLVTIGPDPDAAERAYLEEGEAAGVHQTPTARGRSPWWAQEVGDPCDFAIGNFRRSDYRLTIHTRIGRIQPMEFAVVPNKVTLLPGHRDLVGVLCAYLLSAAGQAALRREERHAGSGLYTLRSGALKSVLVPHLERAEPAWRSELEEILAGLQAADLNDDAAGRAAAKARLDAHCARVPLTATAPIPA